MYEMSKIYDEMSKCQKHTGEYRYPFLIASKYCYNLELL